MSVTVDTNLFVYAHDHRDLKKQQAALRVADAVGKREDRALALQVVGEFYNATTRRLKMPRDEAAGHARAMLRHFPTFSYTADHAEVALDGAREGYFSYWDGLLLASAVAAGCKLFISEDLQHGFTFEGLEIVSPFSGAGDINPDLGERLSI